MRSHIPLLILVEEFEKSSATRADPPVTGVFPPVGSVTAMASGEGQGEGGPIIMEIPLLLRQTEL